MKFIKHFIKKSIRHCNLITVFLISFLSLIVMSSTSFADTSQMNATLSRISTILSQVNPLINLAEQQQDVNTRVKFQFNTLRQDIASIQTGIAQAINRVSIQPRSVKPLSGDYIPISQSIKSQSIASNEISNYKEDNTP